MLILNNVFWFSSFAVIFSITEICAAQEPAPVIPAEEFEQCVRSGVLSGSNPNSYCFEYKTYYRCPPRYWPHQNGNCYRISNIDPSGTPNKQLASSCENLDEQRLKLLSAYRKGNLSDAEDSKVKDQLFFVNQNLSRNCTHSEEPTSSGAFREI